MVFADLSKAADLRIAASDWASDEIAKSAYERSMASGDQQKNLLNLNKRA